MKLEDLQPGSAVRGILPDAAVIVVSVDWHGSDTLTLIYRGPNGRIDEILIRDDEARLTVVEAGRPWSFDGDGALFRLVAEDASRRCRMVSAKPTVVNEVGMTPWTAPAAHPCDA